MIGKKINQLATELAPVSTDLTIIGDPISGVSKKITLAQLGAIFSGAVSFYTNLAGFPATGDINVIYCAKDTQKLYLWSGSAYTEVFPSQALLDTYQLRSEKGVSNGYASLDSSGKVPISQLPSSIMEYKGTWNAATNTPTLANGTGDTGDVYICNVAGTVNFGAGAITFAVGDYVIYSGSIWQRSSGAVGTVTSVAASITGNAIGITGSPVTTSGTLAFAFAGTGAQYIKGDGTLATFPNTIAQAERLITEVYNSTGATLTKGTIVYINGGQGNLPTVTKALATGDSTSAQTFGVVQADITNNNNGYVVVAGKLSDLDTQAYTEGTQLYLSSTTAGTWTSTKQYAPAHLVYVGIVVRSHPTQGIVEVKIMNGFEIDELHNVAAQNPDNNDILQYKTSTSLWTKVAGTTSNIAEGSNLYYTDARSRAALSFTAGSGAYNSTTGVITIPTNTNQLTNGAAYITLASLSAGAGISYNNTTGVIASTITQYTDAMARASISLTTTGTSGAATYNSTTGVLNVPQYAPDLSGYVPTSRTLTINGTAYDLSANRSWSVGTVTSVGLSSATSGVTIGSTPVTTSGTITLAIATASGSQQGLLSSTDWTTFNNKQSALTNPVTGTGTTNYLPKFTGTSTIGNSLVFDNGTNVAIGTASPSAYGGTGLTIQSNTTANIAALILRNSDSSVRGHIYTNGSGNTIVVGSATSSNLQLVTADTVRATIDTSGNLGLGVTPSAWGTSNSARALQMNAGSLFSFQTSQLHLEQNSYFNSGFFYVNDGFATAYRQVSGAHSWHLAPSGTAGNAISFTQAMTLNASGNLSLGITDATGNANRILHINGADSAELHLTRSNSGSSSTFGGYVNFDGSNNFNIQNRTGGAVNLITGTTTALSIASTGAATFSSSVTAANDIYVANSDASAYSRVWLQNTGASGRQYLIGVGGNTSARANLFYINDATADATRFVINSSGNVGINTISPTTYKLQIDGAAGIISSSNAAIEFGIRTPDSTFNDSYLIFGTATNNRAQIQVTGSSANTGSMIFTTYNAGAGAEKMRITSGGQVQYPNTGNNLGLGSYTSNQDKGITNFYQSQNFPSTNAYTRVFDIVSSGDATGGGAIRFMTSVNNTAPATAMYLAPSGNVGIGTTSPASILNLKSSTTTELRLESVAGTYRSFIGFRTDGQKWDVGVNLNDTNDALSFNSVGTERMRLTSGGLVGIGVTNPSEKLHLRDTTNGYVGLRLEGNGNYAGSDWTIYASSLSAPSANDFLGFYNNSTTDSATAEYKFRLFKTGVAEFIGDVKVKTLEVTNATTYGSSGGISTYMQITVNGNNYVIPLHQTP